MTEMIATALIGLILALSAVALHYYGESKEKDHYIDHLLRYIEKLERRE